jgi:hypothetical protein
MSIKSPLILYSYIEAPTHKRVQRTKSPSRHCDIPIDEEAGVQGTKSLAGVWGVPAHHSLLAAAGGESKKKRRETIKS